jgi:hypothetical protein
MVEVTFTITNIGGRDLYLARCGARIITVVDQGASERGGLTWRPYSSGGCTGLETQAPLLIRPGEAESGSVAMNQAGIYRLAVGVTADPATAFAWDTHSQAFVVYPN